MAIKDANYNNYSKLVRHYQQPDWTYEKTSRMAVYVFLYNKLRGMPKSFGLPNDGISWRYNNYIKEHFEELCERFNLSNGIQGLDLSHDHFDENGNRVKGGLSTFIEEIDQYSEYATEIGKVMNDPNNSDKRNHIPSDDAMGIFLEVAKDVRTEHFERIRASVKVEGGYDLDKEGKNKEGIQVAEKTKKEKEIDEHKRQIRREVRHTFWHGLGFVASAGVLALSAITIFSPLAVFGVPSSLATLAVGAVGGLISGPAMSRFGHNIVKKLFWFHGAHEHMRDLKGKRGMYGKRGLSQIDHTIELNRGVLAAYGLLEKMVKPVTYYKRKEKIGEQDLDAGKLLDKDGNIIALSPNNEITGSDGKKYKFDITKNTLTGPLGDPAAKVFHICPGGVIKDVENREVTLDNVQIPYIEAIKNKVPTEQEFIAEIKRLAYEPIPRHLKGKDKKDAIAKRKYYRTLITAPDTESQFTKLYKRCKERYGYMKGVGERTRSFVTANKTIVEDNKEIVLEREDFYNSVFNISFEIDAKNPERPPVGLEVDETKIDFTQYPSFDPNSKKFAYKYNVNLPLSDFVQALRELKDDKTTYETHHETIKYQHYETRAAEMMPVIIQRELFDKPLTGPSVQNCLNILENSVVSDTLKRHNAGDRTPYVKGILRFIQSEQNDKVNPISTDLGVTFADQLCTTSAEDMENACSKSLGIDKGSPDWSTIEDVATQIANMNEKELAKSIESRIATISNDKARNYLSKMVENRKNEVGYGKNYIYNMLLDGRTSLPPSAINEYNKFASILSNIQYNYENNTFSSGSYSEQEIREMINGLPNIDGIKGDIEALLNEQFKSVERGFTDKIRAKAMVAIKNNSVTGPKDNGRIEPIINYIEELKFDNLGTPDLQSFFIENIDKIQPTEVKEYLKMKLRNKIEKLYEQRFNSGGYYTDENALKDLTKDLHTVERMKLILGDARKERILAGFEPKINFAFDRMLKIKELYIFEDGDLSKLNRELRVFLDQSYEAGGFKQFFARDTDKANEIKAKIDRIRNVIDISGYLNGRGDGVSTQTDTRVPESKIFLGIYFSKDRNLSDPLINSIKNVDNFMNDAPMNSFGAGAPGKGVDIDGSARDYIKRLQMFINGKSYTDHNGNPIGVPCKLEDVSSGTDKEKAYEQIALLLVYKRKVLSLFKAHLRKFMENRPDIQNFIRNEGSDYIRQIRELWEPIMKEIDDKYNELCSIVNTDESFRNIVQGYNYIPAMNTLKAATSAIKISSYVNSSDSVIMDGPSGPTL